MTQAKTTQGQSDLAVLSDVIQLIATGPSSESAVSHILQHILSAAEASGVALVIFDEPEKVFTLGQCENLAGKKKLLQSISNTLYPGVHGNTTLPNGFRPQYKGWAIAPIGHPNTFGAIWFSYETPPIITAEKEENLKPLISALTILGMNIQARETHERSHQLTLSLLNSITDPLLVLDDNRQLLLMNPAAEKIFRTTINAARGKSLQEVVNSEELSAMAEGGNTLNEWITSDGKTFIPRVEAVRHTGGDIEGWVLALRDVTQFKKLNRNQSEFMRIVSHDLRSPLTSMQGFASMLELGLVGDLNEKQKHFVSKILAGITQMTALVDNIQDAGRYDPETGFYDLSRSQVDLGEMVNRIVENHLVPAEKALSISVTITDDVPIINADANMLERAVINLFDNAIKYTPDGGKIEVGVKRSNHDVVVSVRDSGLGISEEAQRHLFERHVRIAREEHKKIKGSGLGLFIVRSVAQRHGGDAWVESKEGEGSTFFIGIPLDGPNLVTAGKS